MAQLGRRKVLELTVVFTGAAMTGLSSVLASACGSDDTGTTNPPQTNKDAGGGDTGTTGRSDASTEGGSKTDSSTAKTYAIKGTSDHDHQVTLDPTDLSQLKSGVSVAKTSTDGGTTHDHQVTILCT